MNEFSTPEFPILYRPDLDILVGRWMIEIGRIEEIKQNYVQLFRAAAAAGNCCFWLLDARRRFRTTHEISSWVNQNAPGQALEKLGSEIRIAFLLAPHQLLADSPPFPMLFHPTNGHAMSAQFTDEGEATAWLLTQQGIG